MKGVNYMLYDTIILELCTNCIKLQPFVFYYIHFFLDTKKVRTSALVEEAEIP